MGRPRKTETQVSVIEPKQEVAALSGPTNLIELAIEKGANIDTIERLMALYERERAEKARRAFHEALSKFQSVVPPIPHNKKGYENRYSYADLEQIYRIIQKPLHDHGFTVSYKFKDVKKDSPVNVNALIEETRKFDLDKKKQTVLENIIRAILSEKDIEVTCIITHIEGHSEESKMIGPEDYSGSKNSIQARGSSTTYLERYALIGALNLVTADGDVDGGKMKPTDKEQIKDKREQVGNRWEAIKERIKKGENLETVEKHFIISDDQRKEAREIIDKRASLAQSSDIPDVETFKEICKQVMQGKNKISDFSEYAFTEDQKKSLSLMEQQANKTVKS